MPASGDALVDTSGLTDDGND
eukprot:COSAG06_NODE_34246_length_477_cov_1.089947_2_plen_20_part_01